MRTVSKFTCKKGEDNWWYVYDRDGIFWGIHQSEEEAKKYCAEWNKDADGYRYWQAREADKAALRQTVCEIESELKEHGKIRNS